jgi:hypothetical protein
MPDEPSRMTDEQSVAGVPGMLALDEACGKHVLDEALQKLGCR